jgi:hypothetical protein
MIAKLEAENAKLQKIIIRLAEEIVLLLRKLNGNKFS